MNRDLVKKCGSLIFAMGFFLTAAGLAFHMQREKSRADIFGTAALYLETPLCAEDIETLREAEGNQTFTAWGELADAEVIDPDLGKGIRTELLLLDGTSELVLPLAPVLPQGDTYGCLIGEKTAWELFGSTKVTGDQIRIGDETRMIRGVVDVPQSGVVLGGNIEEPAEAGADAQEDGRYYERITVGGGKAEDTKAFLERNGLDGELLRLDYLNSPGWLTELIPGKWSDFPGWMENFARSKQDFLLLTRVQKNSVELYYMRRCFLYLRDVVLEAVCLAGMSVCILRFWRKRSGKM